MQAGPRRQEGNVADDKSKRGSRIGAVFAGGTAYEVHYFARKHGIAASGARQLLQRIGPDRPKLNKVAETPSGKSTGSRWMTC
jgi:hypothetical protein